MNADDWKQPLRKNDPPDPGPAYWLDFPSRVTRRIRTEPSREAVAHPRPFAGTYSIPVGAVAACVFLLGFLLFQRVERALRPKPDAGAVIAACFDEAARLFPDRLRAVSEIDGELRLDVAETPTFVAEPRVYLDILGPAGPSRHVTSSGQQIRIGDVPHDVVVDGRGEVWVAGPTVVWSSTTSEPGEYRIQARVLPPGS